MHFCIRACDVSALAGRNIFRSRRVAIRRLVDGKICLHENYSVNNENKRLIAMIRRGTNYQRAVTCSKLTSEICCCAEQECREVLQSVCPVENIDNLYRRYQHLYLKDRGVAIEQIVINKLKDSGKNIPVVSKKERSFSKTFTSADGKHSYTVFGCVDCVEVDESGNNTLVEIKSRKSQSLHYQHDVDQITTYLVISDWPLAYLVEYVDDNIKCSESMTLGQALTTWDKEIKEQLEQSLADAAQKIIDMFP